MIFPQQRRNERIERSSHDETLLDNLFRSSVVMISYPNSTLKPIRDLRKYTLNSEVSAFPQRAFNDSILSAKIVGDIPRSFPHSSILDMPRHEKKNIYSTSICASSVLFPCIPKEEFLVRGTDETLMVKIAVCPITLI